MSDKPVVSIVMGSDSDLEIMREAGKALRGIFFDVEGELKASKELMEELNKLTPEIRKTGLHLELAGLTGEERQQALSHA